MHRRKLGCGLPANAWSRDAVIALANHRLIGTDLVLYNFVDPDTLRDLVARQGQENELSKYQLWPLLVAESWLKQHIG
jgi:hypothetical protein